MKCLLFGRCSAKSPEIGARYRRLLSIGSWSTTKVTPNNDKFPEDRRRSVIHRFSLQIEPVEPTGSNDGGIPLSEKTTLTLKDWAQKAPLSGCKEAFVEPWRPLRYLYRVLVLLFVCCTVYDSYVICSDWLRNDYRSEVRFVYDEPLPMSNVTICGQLYINETFIRNSIVVTDELLRLMQNHSLDVDEFYRAFTIYSMPSTRNINPEIQQRYRPFIRRVMELNVDLFDDFSRFISAALPSCRSVLRNCYFDSVPFDCCERARLTLGQDGACYQLTLNFDLMDVDHWTMRQRQPGPLAGLQLDAVLDVSQAWMGDQQEGGFLLYAQSMPLDALGIPVAAPVNAHTFVELKATRHRQKKDCYRTIPTLPVVEYYDWDGVSCMFADQFTNMMKLATCLPTMEFLFPPRSTSCKVQSIKMGLKYLFGGFEMSMSSSDAEFALRYAIHVEETVSNVFKRKNVLCKPICDNWQYEMSSSFAQLESETDSWSQSSFPFSRISIFYSSIVFKEETEEEVVTSYLAFCNFGNAIGLYLGLSIASIAKLFVVTGQAMQIFVSFDNKPAKPSRIGAMLVPS